MGLPIENAKAKGDSDEDGAEGRRNGSAQYVRDRVDLVEDEQTGEQITWEAWLQKYRVELNAMTMPQFMRWFEAKRVAAIEQADIPQKVIPPQAVITVRRKGSWSSACANRFPRGSCKRPTSKDRWPRRGRASTWRRR